MSLEVRSGTVLAGFRLKSLIGEGATGAVYFAEDPASGQRVAMKLLMPDLVQDQRFRERFLRESRVAASLAHPRIVSTVAAGEENGVLYLAMAYIEGSDLRLMLQREGPLAPDRALKLIAQVAGALDAAHEAGLVHRDVKPGNILLTTVADEERAYVCDFGLARHASSVRSLTGDRGFVGTIDYVPPEQIEGGAIDHRADIYSLGCVLYECLVGARPFERESELSVVFAHLNEAPPRASELQPDLPKAFDNVFATALAKSPGERYSTCGELVHAARAALRGQAIPRSRRRSHRLVLGVGIVLAAVVAAVAGVLATRGTNTSITTPPRSISADSIAGAPLGLKPTGYMKLFGRPWRRNVTKISQHSRLTFPERKVAVYFKGLTDTAVEITTWNRAYKTAEGIGPCSSIDDLKRAYGSKLRPSPVNTIPPGHGKVYAYLVGENLIFAAAGRDPIPGPSKHVTAVAIYYGDAPAARKHNGALGFAGFIATSETNCSVASARAR